MTAIREKTSVFEQHHEVLLAWTRLYRKDFIPREVLTLDHHTDILPAFHHVGGKGCFDCSSEESVQEALRTLRHDEHLDWALRTGVVSKSVIIAHEYFTVEAHPSMTVRKSPLWPETQDILNGTERARETAEKVLESDFLETQLEGIRFGKHFILDIDLDNFLTPKALEPKDSSLIFSLAEKAEIITVSLERDWVKLLKFSDVPPFTPEDILEKLLFLLEGKNTFFKA